MAVLWLSGSAEPGASVNVALAEEKSLCPGAGSSTWGGGGGALSLWVGERELGAKGTGLEGSLGS